MLSLLALCPAVLLAVPGGTESAPVASHADPLNRSSPEVSVAAFLQACRMHDYARACSYLDLRKLPQADRLKVGSGLAQQLEQILDRDTHFDVAELSADPKGSGQDGVPENRDRVDSFQVDGQRLNIDLERIVLRSGIWIWLFSADTVSQIPQLERATSESLLERHLPAPLVAWKIAETPVWQWAALALLALGSAALTGVICPLAVRWSEPLFGRFAPRLGGGLFASFVAPLRVLAAVTLFRLGLQWIEPPTDVRLLLGRALALLFFLGLFLLFARIVDLIIVRLRATLRASHHVFSYSALPLAARIFKITLCLLALAGLLNEWGYNTTAILAGLGVGGIAIALAAQKTVENFFGGVSVVADRPVAVGDFCKFGDRSGTVEDIGLRSTRIRTPERTLVSVPNGQFSTMTIENLSRRDKMLFHFMLNLRRDTKPDQVRQLLESIARILAGHEKVEAGSRPVHFVGVGTYSLDLEVTVYILTADDDAFAEIRQELFLTVLDAVEAAGTALALPTQASVVYSPMSQRSSSSATSAEDSTRPSPALR